MPGASNQDQRAAPASSAPVDVLPSPDLAQQAGLGFRPLVPDLSVAEPEGVQPQIAGGQVSGADDLVLLGAANAAGGYVVTERMLAMFKSKEKN